MIGFIGGGGVTGARRAAAPTHQCPRRTGIVCEMKKLFVGGISWATDDNMLNQAFSEFGEVADARVIYDRDTGRSRGFGFVTFDNDDDAQTAMDGMNGKMLDGRTIRVNEAIDRRRDEGGFRR